MSRVSNGGEQSSGICRWRARRGEKCMTDFLAPYRSAVCLVVLMLFCVLCTADAHHIVMHSGPFGGVVLALVVDPSQTETLYVGVFGQGVFKSSDGGRHWQIRSRGLDNPYVLALALDVQAPTTLYTGTDAGVFKSTQGGEWWQQSNQGLGARNVRSVVVHPQQPSTLYVGTDRGIFKSTDGGQHWQEINQGLADLDVRTVVLDPVQAHTLYAATFGGIFQSTNGGETWEERSKGLLVPQVRVLTIEPDHPEVLYAGTVGGIFASRDRAQSWQPKNQGFALAPAILSLTIAAVQPSVLYAGTVRGVFRYTDAPAVWSFLDSGPHMTVTFIVVDPQRPHTLYMGSGGLLFKSVDGGERWENMVQEVVHEEQHSSVRMPDRQEK